MGMSLNNKAAVVKFEINYIMRGGGGQFSAHLLSLHNSYDEADNRSALTSHSLNTRALVKIQHLFIFSY